MSTIEPVIIATFVGILGVAALAMLLERSRLPHLASPFAIITLLGAVATAYAYLPSSSGATAPARLSVATVDVTMPATVPPRWASNGKILVIRPDERVLAEPAAPPPPPPGKPVVDFAAALQTERIDHQKTSDELAMIRQHMATLEATELQRQRQYEIERGAIQHQLNAVSADKAKLTQEATRLGMRIREFEAAHDAINVATKKADPVPAKPPPEARPAAASPNKPAESSVVANVASVSAASTIMSSGSTIDGLRSTWDGGVTDESVIIKRVDDKELVAGKSGSWYRVSLSHADRKTREAFERGTYILGKHEPGFQKSAMTFRDKYLAALPASAYTLFVQAYATNTGFARLRTIEDANATLKSISFHDRPDGQPRFTTALAQQALPDGNYYNSHLPLLRAGYVKTWLATLPGGPLTVELLKGELKPATDTSGQSFDLFVFVDWNKQ